jgi:hypothetical protein
MRITVDELKHGRLIIFKLTLGRLARLVTELSLSLSQ